MMATDPSGPPRAQQTHGKAMRASWRDPDDLRPNARRVREITGWHTFDPLRIMAKDPSSSVTEEHIRAADYLRWLSDIAAGGLCSRDNILPIGASVHLPRLGPTSAAQRSERAGRDFIRAMKRFSTETRWLILCIVIWNRTLEEWCRERQRLLRTETERLMGALDLLAEHFSTEIDERRADIPTKAA